MFMFRMVMHITTTTLCHESDKSGDAKQIAHDVLDRSSTSLPKPQ